MLTVPLKLVNSTFFSSKSDAFSEKAIELEAFMGERFYKLDSRSESSASI